MVSRAAWTPDHSMNAATTAPHQPSIWRPQAPAAAPNKAAAVARQSLRLSRAMADIAAE